MRTHFLFAGLPVGQPCQTYSQTYSHLFVGALAIVLLAIFVCPSNAQVRQKTRNSSVDAAKFLKRLDRNRNEILDKEEMVGGTAKYLQGLGFDTSRPLSLSKVLRKVEGKNKKNDGKKSSNSSVVRKVPGFGVEASEREGVSKFGGLGSGKGIDMNAKYGERVMKLVERTIKGYDANKNGYLDPNEIKKARWGKPTPEQSDRNRDGILTQIELAERYLARDRDARGSSGGSNTASSRAALARSRAKTSFASKNNRSRTSTPSNSRNTPRSTTSRTSGRFSNNRTSGGRSTSKSTSKPYNSGSERYARYAAGLMTQYDQNKDGKLDKGELGKMRRPPKNADVNGDGFVTTQELTNKLSGKTSTSSTTPKLTGAAVKNKEARTRAIEAAERSRSASNRSSSNRTSDSRSRRASGSFTDYDKNQDGQVQMHEFADDWDGEIFAQFKAKDQNGDGIITSDEWNGG